MGEVTGEPKSNTTSVMVGLGAIGGSIILISLLAAPFLVVPASRKLGSLPWMVCSIEPCDAFATVYFILTINLIMYYTGHSQR